NGCQATWKAGGGEVALGLEGVLGHGKSLMAGAIRHSKRAGTKKPLMLPSGALQSSGLAQDLDLVSLHAFLALYGFEGDFLAFFQALEAVTFDSAEMHEQIRTAFGGDEAKALLVVEPFNGAGLTIRHVLFP